MKKHENVAQLARNCVNKMAQAADRMPWEEVGFYSQFLAQTYFYVRHATRVLAAASSRCTLGQEPLHLRLIDGINEEKGHEVLALRDLQALKCDISQFSELEETSCYYQTLYYKIQAEGPFALPGYFIPLEGLAAVGFSKPMARVLQSHGKKAGSFIEMHCHLDAGHFDQGLQALAQLSDADLKTVSDNLPYSTELYVRMLDRIAASQENRLQRAA